MEVGWHVRFEPRFGEGTRLLIATEGILTARLQQDPLLSGFATVVLDEFHERSIHADLAIALAKQAMLARDDLRLVVMSATIDAERVASFLGDCEVIRIPGRPHSVTIHYEPSVEATDAVMRGLDETSGDVLCFQPGASEIARTIGALRSAGRSRGVDILPLHGSLTWSQQAAALSSSRDSRRVIVCTNIAETSITVPGVAAVVDSGLEKVARYDSQRAIDSLTTERISGAAADQRAGRAGRTGPGVAYRLWSAADRLKPYREPEIHRVDLSGVVLAVARWGGDPRELEWFEPPDADALAAAISLLNRMGALRGVVPTDVGRRMLELPIPSRLSRIVVEANGNTAAVRAAALLSERVPLQPRGESSTSDALSMLDRWSEVPAHIRTVAEQIAGRSRRSALPNSSGDAALRRAILAGYPDRVARRREPQSRRFLLSSGTGAVLSEQSGVRDAEYVVALDLSAPTRDDAESRINMASAIEPTWLVPTHRDVEHWLDERGVVKAREVVRYDALVLAERPIPPEPGEAARLLAAEWVARPVPDPVRRLLCRMTFAGRRVELPQLVRTAACGAKSLDEIDVVGAMPRETAVAIDREAPESLTVPSGRQVRLDYGEDGTVSASVKLQELFGLEETPRVGPRGEPVLLVLLAPNGRPVQVTRDLRSFWNRTYPEVRRELRGGYPRHPWPDNPWTAQPTHRAKRRL
jgi:ATP-dependent helicase HrpB